MHAAPQTTGTPRRPSDPLPHAPHVGGQAPAHVASTPRQQQQQQPVKAELVTTELDDEPPRQQQQAPPPYHIAAARSKQASTFSALHSTSTGNSHTSGNVNSNPNSHVNSPHRKTNGGHQVRNNNISQEHLGHQSSFFWGLFPLLRACLCWQCSDKIRKYRGHIETVRKKRKSKS